MDKEIEVLSRVIANNLFLSQFESFRALILSLFKRNPRLSLSILQTIVSNAGRFDSILWSHSCPSPSHLTYLTCLELLRFHDRNDGAEFFSNLHPDKLRLEAEFLLLAQIISAHLCRFLDLDSITHDDVVDTEFESRPEDLADASSTLADPAGFVAPDPAKLLDRILDLGYALLRGDVNADADVDANVGVVVNAEGGFLGLTDAEAKCLRKVFLDQEEVLDALCRNIDGQLNWSDPFDSGLAISVSGTGGPWRGRSSEREEEVRALDWIRKNVQIGHLDALRECVKSGFVDVAVSHLRFLHQGHGVDESEYR